MLADNSNVAIARVFLGFGGNGVLANPSAIVVDQKTMELLKNLEKYPGVKTLSTIPRTHSPVLPITFLKGTERFSYFSFISVGTPRSITAQELRTECMFPLELESK